ncbi:MAG: SDR family oxidoreductase [Terriglobia bacterium]
MEGKTGMSKVLIAGATGYLGRFVAREFKQRGYWVRALARHPDKLKASGPSLQPAIYDLVDDVFVGEVTKPETLRGACEGVEVVFSSIGITRQRGGLSYMDVDYQGNKNLLDLALKASVRKFVFVHVLNAQALAFLENIRAKQKFVENLRKSGMAHVIVCPNGFFSDMSEFLKMAVRGTVYLIGDGSRKINPIHGADLAKVCVDAVNGKTEEISVGGPVVYTYQEIAETAFSVLGKTPKIRHVPVWMARSVASTLRPFSKRLYGIATALTTMTQTDCEAPKAGTRTLKDYYQELATSSGRKP